jgi:hypothetical protein
MLVFGVVASLSIPAAYAANTITVQGKSLDGKALNMWITIQQNGSTVKTGFAPLTFSGVTGSTYTIVAHDYNSGNIYFDHWGNGSTNEARTVTLNSNVWLDAFYRTSAPAQSTTTTAYDLVITSADASGNAITGYYTTIKTGSTTVKTGFTPLTHAASPGTSYTVSVSDYGSSVFDHWENGSTSRTRTLTVNSDVTAVAYYKTGSSGTTTSGSTVTSGSGINSLIPKTGVFVALYMYPGSTGSTHWQKVIDEKTKHPSVPIVVAFNPSSGPGSSKNSVIATWVDKLQDAGIIAIGYTYDDYGTRSLSALKADADRYKNWYNADGLFIDEFTNKLGYENHYKDLTTYAKSIGMKLTMGNPGTDVPPSYIGKVDIINTSEGRGYISLTDPNLIGAGWVSGGYLGWHKDYGKRNFVVIRYDTDWLDSAFVNGASDKVGLMYITNGDDSNGRWFHVPPYFSTLVSTLDK